MAFAFEKDEQVGAGVRRIAVEQLDLALESLGNPGENLDAAIHRARQSLKRLRALLALVRAELGEETYERENACFRDAARLFASARDAAVLVHTLDAMVERSGELLSRDALTLREALARSCDAGVETEISYAFLRRKASEALADARSRVADWTIPSDGFAAVGPGVEAVCRRGRELLAAVHADPHSEAFHEWRKPVKQLLHHIQLLTPVWPRMLESLAGELQALSDALNDSHDLANLRQAVLESGHVAADERDALLAAIDSRRLELEPTALALGERLYAEKPRAFTRRLRRYWLAWRRSDATSARADVIDDVVAVAPHARRGRRTPRPTSGSSTPMPFPRQARTEMRETTRARG